MSKLINILIQRDSISEIEAKALIDECREDLLSGNDYAIQEYLGLEDDYIFDVLEY